MGKKLPLLALTIGLVFAAQTPAHGLHIDNEHCGYSTDYDIRVNADGIAFERQRRSPAKVFMHDGQLRVDGRPVALSDADADRLRQYEGDVRQLLPAVAGIVREGLDIGFSAMTMVATTFAAQGEQRDELLQRLNRKHAAALRQIDRGIGSGVWKRDDIADVIEDGVESSVSEMVGTITASAVSAALSGDDARVAALQARADALEKAIEQQVDARADRLGQRAEALCPRLTELEQLQQQWQFRLGDGSRLQLLSRTSGHEDVAVAAAGR